MQHTDAPPASRTRRVLHSARAIVANKWFRLGFFVALLAVVGVLLHNHTDFVRQAVGYIRRANPWWTAAAVAAIAVSISAMSEMMISLLRSVDVRPPRRSVYALTLTCNSVALTFPGGTAIAIAMGFREQMKWGASSMIATWYAVVSGVISAAGLAIYGLVAFYVLGAQLNGWTLIGSVAVLCALLAAIKWSASNLEKVEVVVLRLLGWGNRRLGHPENRGADKVANYIDTLRTVDLPLHRILIALMYSLINWGADWVCLLFCLWAMGVHPSIPSVMLAFVTMKIVGTAQVTPGSLGTVEATLVATLVATGLPSATAFAATVLFRLISFALLAIVGWIVFIGQYGLGYLSSAAKEQREIAAAKEAAASDR